MTAENILSLLQCTMDDELSHIDTIVSVLQADVVDTRAANYYVISFPARCPALAVKQDNFTSENSHRLQTAFLFVGYITLLLYIPAMRWVCCHVEWREASCSAIAILIWCTAMASILYGLYGPPDITELLRLGCLWTIVSVTFLCTVFIFTHLPWQ